MKDIETVRNEIEQRENSIKEMEEKLKEARKELRQFEKYRGLKFDVYREYGSGKYYNGMARDAFLGALRSLTLYIIGVEKRPSADRHCLDFQIKKAAELNFAETKLCNDFLDEIYPIIEKYMDIVLDDTRTPQNDEVRE
jgi:hypothetical protein